MKPNAGLVPCYEEGSFTILEPSIGSGSQATVWQGEFHRTRMEILLNRPIRLIAIKKFNKAISMADTSTEWREIEILKANNKHPRIVQIFGMTIDKYNNTLCSGYIMEYMQNGSLDRVIHDESIIYDLGQIYSWLSQAASAFVYLHEQNIVHRDIKPSNLLLGYTLDDLKVGDFGLARHTLGESSITRGIGTDGYTAPEVFQTGKYNKAADVYSFTTTIWEIFHRKKPLDEFKEKSTQHELTSKDIVEGWHPAIDPAIKYSSIKPDIEDLLERGWNKDPLQRITLKEILAAVQPTILVLTGNWNCKMHLLKEDRTQWSTLSLKPYLFVDTGGAVYLDGEIYIFGGFGPTDKKTYKLNRLMKWTQLADMNEGRRDINNSSVVFDGCIWVFGGWNRNSVEKYIPEENKWIQMPSMKEKRQHAAAAACKGKLFVCGGHNGSWALITVECFDPASEKWTMFPRLPSLRQGHAMISDGICLTVLGGLGDEKSVWKINPDEEKASWKKLPRMKERRCFFGANLLGDNIFAIGAWGRRKKVEVFNGETWKDGPELPEEIVVLCSIVIPAHLAAALSSHQ